MKINLQFLIITLLLFSLNSNAQITKGNWMMGGGASFGNTKSTSNGVSTESNHFSLVPNVGYFLIDKLAMGVSGELALSNRHETNYGIAPFVRYYFLEKEKQFNIFSETSYGIYRINNSDYKYEKFNLKAGAVVFLNSSVGIEAALNYTTQKTNSDTNIKHIYLGVGFQIHLEKE